ncbi:unnamed protein product, partial [Adineta steineri]
LCELFVETVGPKTEDLYKKLPCLVCSASASGIHFGAVTCEACKGFYRRSIKENAAERYLCVENNNCEILAPSKLSCRACRFKKCIHFGMSMKASRIGRQSNLFKESIRQIQNGTTSMVTIRDSARIASMAKRRKIKTKSGRTITTNNEIDIELSLTTKEFIKKVHNAYIMHLKDLPRCIPRETIWWTMASQMTIYAEAVINFCQKTIPGFDNMYEKYEIISSSINSVIMITLLSKMTSIKYPYNNNNNIQPIWNYWQAESTLSAELNAHVPQLTEAENEFRSFESKIKDLHLDEKELSLLLLMIITRTNLNVINEENNSWPKCQYECVQAFSEYTQARRSTTNEHLPIEFYDIIFLVSQLRSLNHRISQCLMNFPWPYIPNLPSFFYPIYLPHITNMSSILNSNYDLVALSPVRSTLNSNNHYGNEFFSDSLNSNLIDVNMPTNNFGTTKNIYLHNEKKFRTIPRIESPSQTSWHVSNMMTNHHSCSSSSSSSPSNMGRFDSRVIGISSDDITVSIRW